MNLNKHLIILALFFSNSYCNQIETSSHNLPEETSTGKSFLVNSKGDTLLTGVPLTIPGKKIGLDEVVKREVAEGIPSKVAIPQNIHKIPEKLRVSPIDIDSLKSLTLGVGQANNTFFNQITGVPIPAKGKIISALQPNPVKALLPTFKDDATQNIKYLDEGQGMNSSRVNAILEDKWGNLWFGTHAGGVTKYDGARFTHYTSDEGLLDDVITSMLEDKDGNLWFGTWASGVSRFDGASFTNYTTAEGLINNEIRVIYEDSVGNIWLGTRGGGVGKYDGEDFTHFTTKEGLGSNTVMAVLEDRNGNLWFGTGDGGVNKFDGKDFYYITTKDGLGSNAISAILEDRNGDLWFGTIGGGISKFDGKSLTQFTIKEGLNDNSILSMFEDDSGTLWLGTESGGINVFDGENFAYITMDEGLSDNTITSIVEDQKGGLWFGTRDGGANVYDRKTFANFPSLADLNGDNVRSIQEDSKGNFWFATWGGGIIKYDGEYLYQYTAEEGIGDNTVWTILEDKRGNLWFGTRFAGLGKYDGENFTNFIEFPGSSQFDIWSVLEDKHGNIWFSTGGKGIFKYDGEFFTQYSTNEGFSADRVWSMTEDESGNIWFATWGGGASVFDGKNFTFYSEKEGLLSNDVWSVLQDKNGNLWFGTYGEGVSVFDGATFFNITTENGLPSDIVNSILQDNSGNIWLGTEKGLAQIVIDPDQPLKAQNNHSNYLDNSLFKIINYSRFDGLKAQDFNVHSTLLDSKNRIWLGTGKGIVIIDRNNFEVPKNVSSLYLNNIEVNGQFVDYFNLNDSLRSRISYTGVEPFFNLPLSLELSHDKNHLTFHFSAIDYKEQHDIEYSYKIVRLNEDWSQPSFEAKADYQNIPFGSYTFQVRFRGKSLEWSEPLAYTFTINPPWWLTPWAYTAYLIAFIIGLWLLISWRTRAHRLKLEEANKLNHRLQQVDQLKDQFLANTSHELRTPLQGIIGISESLYGDAEKVTPEELRENLALTISSSKRLNSLINDILDFSKLKNHDIELLFKPINLQVLIDIVLQSNTPLIKGKDLELINDTPANLPAVRADENRLQQVLYNLIGNAIKFTEKGYIKLNAQEKDDMIQVSIEDTGTGIPENKQEAIFQEFEQSDGSISREFTGTGLGLSISKRLVELHGGKMWVESAHAEASADKVEVSTGSTFFFTLPISTEKATTLAAAKESDHIWQTIPTKEILVPIILPINGDDSIRILVVDDEPINQQVLKNHLSARNFYLTQAMNGEEAIATIQNSEPFNLILLDVMMPRMSGYEVCQKIREKYLASELPVIMVTAKNQLQDVVQGLSTGANDYLHKPFHKEELLARINTQLDLHRIFSVAGKFVPNAFLHSLNRDRLTEVMLGDHIEKEVTVLFTDIRGYTTLSETMTPEQNFKFVNAFHGRMGPIIQQHQGFVNQYLGDAIMAIFPERPEDALKAAIDMQKQLAEYNGERQDSQRKPIKIGVGLHTGSLIMGIIGDQKRMDAATIADTVNTASRIEGLTKHYGTSILLSEDSMEKIENKASFAFRYLGEVLVKGKKEPLGLYECYDGDALEMAGQKAKTQPDFEKGLQLFFNQDFPEAAATFNKILKVNPADETARLFLNKASGYTVEGVPEGWTGVEIMTFK